MHCRIDARNLKKHIERKGHTNKINISREVIFREGLKGRDLKRNGRVGYNSRGS